MNPGDSNSWMGTLPEDPDEAAGGLERVVARHLTLDDLDDPGRGDGVEEVHPEDAFGVLQALGELADRQGGGVDDDRDLGPEDAVKLQEKLALGREVLVDRLDQQVAAGGLGQFGGEFDAGEDRLLLGLRQAPTLDLVVEVGREEFRDFVGSLPADVPDDDAQTGLGDTGRDRPSHHPAADDRNAVQLAFTHIVKSSASGSACQRRGSIRPMWNRPIAAVVGLLLATGLAVAAEPARPEFPAIELTDLSGQTVPLKNVARHGDAPQLLGYLVRAVPARNAGATEAR